MFKQQKIKNKGIVPPKLKGAVFNSLSDLGSALGCKAPEQLTPKDKNCRKCGNAMRQIPGTNVWVCDGMVENADKKTVPCGNRTITAVRPMNQVSEHSSKPKQKNQGNPAKAQSATA